MKPVPRCPGYYADANGLLWSEVRFRKKDRGLRPVGRTCKVNGYFRALVIEDGKKRARNVHILVARAFYGERGEGLQVRHLNGHRDDNRPENLAYGTWWDNFFDAQRHGTRKIGRPPEKRWSGRRAKVSAIEVQWIRQYARMGISLYAIAEAFGYRYSGIYAIVRGKTWRWLPDLDSRPPVLRKYRRSRSGRRLERSRPSG